MNQIINDDWHNCYDDGCQGWAIKAIAEGRKTQTRRVIQPQPPSHLAVGKDPDLARNGQNVWAWLTREANVVQSHIKCPYGVVGDLLYCREAYCHGIEWDDTKPSEVDPLCGGNDIWYFADGPRPSEGWGKKRPAISMPKWVARYRLKITDITVQRVQDINEEDAIAEGMQYHHYTVEEQPMPRGENEPEGYWFCEPRRDLHLAFGSAKAAFADVWDSINAKKGYGWNAANPWVWAITFERLK